MNFQTFTSFFFKKSEIRDWGDDYKVYEFNVAEIKKLAPQFKTPVCQTEINEERVEGIAASYLKHPHFFEHKTTWVVAVVVSSQEVFLMDGQHRLKFVMECPVLPPLTKIRVVAYNIRSEQEMRDLFKDLNHDSFKNKAYVDMGIDDQRVRDEVKTLIEEKYQQWFPKTRKKNTRLQTVTAFVDSLPSDLFQKFKTSHFLLQHLIAQNNAFLTKLGTVELYAEEKDIVLKGQIVFPLIYCNFSEFLQTGEVYYEGPRHRKAISSKTRTAVWTKEFGQLVQAPCPVCLKSTLYKEKPHGFECGHLTSHKNGGTETLENLRPICAHCNQLMATQNWQDFVTPKKKSWFGW
jgi:hypothetical protein